MQNALISAVMAALLASTLVATNAFAAEGDYYEGVDPNARQIGKIDLPRANSVRYGFPLARGSNDLGAKVHGPIDSGDYYEGATRPH